MLGSFRSVLGKSFLNNTQGRKFAAVSAAGLLTFATSQLAKQGGHDHDDHGHKDHGEVPFLIKDPVVLKENADRVLNSRSKYWTWVTVSSLGLGYGLYKGYQYCLRTGGKGTRPGVLAAMFGFGAYFGISCVWTYSGDHIVTELAVNRDLKSMSVKTGLLTSTVHKVNLKDVRPVTNRSLPGFTIPAEGGHGREIFFLPDLNHLEHAGYSVSHNQLLHDLITGNFENVARYNFKH